MSTPKAGTRATAQRECDRTNAAVKRYRIRRERCPACGGQTIEGFDGGNDRLFVHCHRTRTLLAGAALRAWWDEHAKHCKGCDGRDGPAEWVCDFERDGPRWLLDGLAGVERPRVAFELRAGRAPC